MYTNYDSYFFPRITLISVSICYFEENGCSFLEETKSIQ